ncbi:MAG: sel1 repeat family protein [Alphaproteobacteria bacterium]|nr:sel1 repeat family protein [Alphaproteobacteria bacterium]
MFIRLFSVFVTLFIYYSSTSFATDDLFKAIEAWENAEYKKSAELFRPYDQGHPVASPYCVDLASRGLMTVNPDNKLHQIFKIEGVTNISTDWFATSQIIRNINLIKKEIEKLDSKKNNKNAKKTEKIKAKLAKDIAEEVSKLTHKKKIYSDYCCYNKFSFDRNMLLSAFNACVTSFCFDPKVFLETLLPDVAGTIKMNKHTLFPLAAPFQESMKTCTIGESFYNIRDMIDDYTLRYMLIRSAAMFGHRQAQVYMAKNLCKTQQESYYWLALAAEKGDPEGLCHIAFMYEKETFLKTNWQKSMYYSTQAVKANTSHLPNIYYDHAIRLRMEKKIDEALVYYRLAMEHGATDSQRMNFGEVLYDAGRTDELMVLLQQLTQSTDSSICGEACLNIFTLLHINNPDEAQKRQAVEALERAVSCGNSVAAYELGCLYETGLYVEIDLEKALLLFEEAIQNGLSYAYNSAGLIYMKKKNSDADKKAAEYFQIAYSSVPEFRCYAAYNLALMHSDGLGDLECNPVVVEKYFREAMDEPDIRIDAVSELVLFWIRHGLYSHEEGERLLSAGVQEKDTRSLFYMGQSYLFLNPTSNLDKMRLGIEYILDAAKRNEPGAKGMFCFLKHIGVSGVMRANHKRTHQYLQNLEADEVGVYNLILSAYTQMSEKMKKVELQQEDASLSAEESEEEDESFEDLQEADMNLEVSPVLDTQPQSLHNPQIARLESALSELKGKKQVKWRKVQGLMGQMMGAVSGSFRPGKGSGKRVEMAGDVISLHIPHSSNQDATDLKGKRLTSVLNQMSDALETLKKQTPKEDEAE